MTGGDDRRGDDPRGTEASAHLLRTLAAVAPGTRVVEMACGAGAHTEALVRLGFDVWACSARADHVAVTRARLAGLVDDAEARVTPAAPTALGYPDAFAGWVVATGLDAAVLPAGVAEAARVLAPGGWLWIEVLAADGSALADAAREAGLAVAEGGAAEAARGTIRAIYRRPGAVG